MQQFEMMHGMSNRTFWIAFGVIMFLAIITRFWQLEAFPMPIFDEFYYVTMTQQYLAGTSFADVHPPTVRFIFTIVGVLAGATATDRFDDPSQHYGSYPYLPMRVATALAGVALVAWLMLLAKEVTQSSFVGLLVGFLAVFENMLLLLSRYIVPEIFLLLFGVMGLWAFLRSQRAELGQKKRLIWLLLTGLCFGLSLGTKLYGGLFLAMAWYLFFTEYCRTSLPWTQAIVFLIMLPALVVILLMGIHFSLLTPEGPVLNVIGSPDERFNTIPAFETVRQYNPLINFGPYGQRVGQLVIDTLFGVLYTFTGHFHDFSSTTLSSPWWSWLVLLKPFTLFYEAYNGSWRVLYLIGNPAIWWGGLALLGLFLYYRWYMPAWRSLDVFVFGFGFNLLVFALLPRPLFIYHYLPSLLCLIVISASVLTHLYRSSPKTLCTLLFLVIGCWVWFAPLTYGWQMNTKDIQLRQWLPTWNIINP